MEERLTATVQIRLSAEEKRKLIALAKAEGRTLSGWARRLLTATAKRSPKRVQPKRT